MKKSVLVLLSALSLSFGLTSMTSNNAEYSAGKAGSNGSPGEGTCATGSCHNSFALNSGPGSVSVSIAGLVNGNMYVPGQTYQVSVTVAQQGIGLFGFGLESLQESGANAGSWTPSTDSHVLNATVSGNSRATIAHIDNSGFASNTRTWNFSWTAPATAIPVTMYAAGNAANGNTTRVGDYIYTSSLSLMPAPALQTPVITALGGLMFCEGETNLLSVDPQTNVTFTWFDGNGAGIGTGSTIEVSSGGCYTVVATLGNEQITSSPVCVMMDAPDATFTGLADAYCLNEEPTTMIPVNVGGVFAGPGVSNGAFIPSEVVPGSYEVSYTYTSPETGCSETSTQSVLVQGLPQIGVLTTGNETLIAEQSNASYQWIDCENGTPVPGATQSQLTLSEEVPAGNYAVQITLNGCSATSECYPLISLGTSEFEAASKNFIYPNPAADYVQMVSSSAMEWKLFDAFGKLMLAGSGISGKTRIDVTTLSAGCYYLHMTDGKQLKSIPLLKQ
jgi:hypothetical protein